VDDVRKLAKDLRLLSASAFSEATAAAINRVAHAANVAQSLNVRKDFTLRNKFTLGSLMMFKASPKKDANKIDALVGSKSPYLPEQESGGEAVGKDGKPVKIMPALASRRGSWDRPVASRFRLKALGPIGRRMGNGRMTPKGAQAFWLKGGSLKQRTLFYRTGKKLLKVRIATKGPIKIKPTHWHAQAMARFGKPSVMSAAWGVELAKGLSKLGAR